MDESALRSHVEALACEPRVPGTPAHARAAAYVHEQLESFGFRTTVQKNGPDGDNIVAEFGRSEWPLVVVGAHYDSVAGSPGADDNASGVAALLEVARVFSQRHPHASTGHPLVRIQFVAFDLEEVGLLGSTAFCRSLRHDGADVRAMMSLEMLGYTGPRQTLVPGAAVSRTTGDFLAVVANARSERLLSAFRSNGPPHPAPLPVHWGERVTIPMECVTVREGTEAAQLARLSDHGAFWDAGWRALLVTDTAFLRNPHYHAPTDTPGTLDYDFLLRSAQKVTEALLHIAYYADSFAPPRIR